MAEGTLQSKILKYLNSRPGCVAENVSGNANQSGRADINACYKGKCLKLELKDPKTGYKPSKQQLLYLEKWAAAGAITAIIHSQYEVECLLQTIDEGVFREA